MGSIAAPRPTRETSDTTEIGPWLRQLQHKVDDKFNGPDRIFVYPKDFGFSDAHQREGYHGYEVNAKERAHFGEVARPTEPKDGRSGFLGICFIANESYVGKSLPASIGSAPREERPEGTANQWDLVTNHCWLFYIVPAITNGRQKGRILLIKDCDQPVSGDQRPKDMGSVVTQRARRLAEAIEQGFRQEIVGFFVGNMGDREMGRNKCVDLTTRCVETLSGYAATPVNMDDWESDPRLAGCIQIKRGGLARFKR